MGVNKRGGGKQKTKPEIKMKTKRSRETFKVGEIEMGEETLGCVCGGGGLPQYGLVQWGERGWG